MTPAARASSTTEGSAALRSRHLLAAIGVATACGFAAQGASAQPMHLTVSHRFAQPPTTAQCEPPPPAGAGIACYNPAQFQQAYDLNPLFHAGLNGSGKTIVIVDSFGSSTIQSDLQTFDQGFGLPAPPSFNIITPDGPVNQNAPAAPGWAVETSLDVEWAHAMAPGANILLVET